MWSVSGGSTIKVEDLRWSIVEHSIDSSPLLEEHGYSRHDDPLEHGRSLEERRNGDKLQFDCVPCTRMCQARKVGLNCPLLEQRLCLDLKELNLDELIID